MVIDPRVAGAVLDADAQGLPGLPRRVLRVGLPHHAHAEQLREAVQGWLQRQALRVFKERCAHFAPRLNVRVRRLSLSSAATRWGSASEDGAIWLHWRLIHFTLPVIDYVVAHELAHLREMNHSRAFWEVVRSVVPDYERARRTLDDRRCRCSTRRPLDVANGTNRRIEGRAVTLASPETRMAGRAQRMHTSRRRCRCETEGVAQGKVAVSAHIKRRQPGWACRRSHVSVSPSARARNGQNRPYRSGAS